MGLHTQKTKIIKALRIVNDIVNEVNATPELDRLRRSVLFAQAALMIADEITESEEHKIETNKQQA